MLQKYELEEDEGGVGSEYDLRPIEMQEVEQAEGGWVYQDMVESDSGDYYKVTEVDAVFDRILNHLDPGCAPCGCVHTGGCGGNCAATKQLSAHDWTQAKELQKTIKRMVEKA